MIRPLGKGTSSRGLRRQGDFTHARCLKTRDRRDGNVIGIPQNTLLTSVTKRNAPETSQYENKRTSRANEIECKSSYITLSIARPSKKIIRSEKSHFSFIERTINPPSTFLRVSSRYRQIEIPTNRQTIMQQRALRS